MRILKSIPKVNSILNIVVTFAFARLITNSLLYKLLGSKEASRRKKLMGSFNNADTYINNDIAMQVVAVGFIISAIQDSCETVINSSGDALFTATAEFSEWIREGRKLPL